MFEGALVLLGKHKSFVDIVSMTVRVGMWRFVFEVLEMKTVEYSNFRGKVPYPQQNYSPECVSDSRFFISGTSDYDMRVSQYRQRIYEYFS